MTDSSHYDCVVIGAGIGGLTAAALLARAGRRTLLLESHDKPGGCAGFYERHTPLGRARFDVGATALMGLADGQPLHRLCTTLGVDLPARRTRGFLLHLPDRTVDVRRDADLVGKLDAPPDRAAAFWRLQAWLARLGWRVAARGPALPIQSRGDLLRTLAAAWPDGLPIGWAGFASVQSALRAFGLHASRPFTAAVDMLLADTTQTDRHDSPLLNAALCLDIYRRGLWRAEGGMGQLALGLADAVARHGGEVAYRQRVARLERDGGRWRVHTHAGRSATADTVVANLPLELLRRLSPTVAWPVGTARHVHRQQDTWGAFTLYLAAPAETVPDDGVYFHQVLQSYPGARRHGGHFGAEGQNLLCSLSLPADRRIGPAGLRTITVSTHTRLEQWQGLDRAAHLRLKDELSHRLLTGVRRALPDAVAACPFVEAGSPRGWERYTRRPRGGVGGPVVRLATANLRSTPARPGPPGLWLVGDGVFPGQGTLAVALSALRAVEEITGVDPWAALPTTPSLTREALPLPA